MPLFDACIRVTNDGQTQLLPQCYEQVRETPVVWCAHESESIRWMYNLSKNLYDWNSFFVKLDHLGKDRTWKIRFFLYWALKRDFQKGYHLYASFSEFTAFLWYIVFKLIARDYHTFFFSRKLLLILLVVKFQLFIVQ